MKKYLSIIAVAAMAAYATSALAQGTLGFNNSSTTLVKKWTDANNQTLVNVPKAGGSVQLFWAAAGTAYNGTSLTGLIANNPGWTLGSVTAIGPVDGRFNGGAITLQGVAAGANISYALLGWTGVFGSYDAALAGGAMVGASATAFTMATGGVDPLVPPPSISTTFTGLTLQPVPEPSTLALAGLGAAALLIFRRRK